MADIFKSNRSKSFGFFMLIMGALIAFVAIRALPIISKDKYELLDIVIGCLIAISIIGLFVWIWTTTYYVVNSDKLIVKSGPLRWVIPIREINLIRLQHDTIGGIIKPTLSWKCIEIRYCKYRSISISPENQDRFIDLLSKANNKIIIK